jgi:hypothetical protein
MPKLLQNVEGNNETEVPEENENTSETIIIRNIIFMNNFLHMFQSVLSRPQSLKH